ncbi:hypothetical protein BTH160X_50110 [Brochothrix thermosphacta]|nr:hypothetical protein BTH160X_50110 [Brochothrix thermosphacta]
MVLLPLYIETKQFILKNIFYLLIFNFSIPLHLGEFALIF